MARIRSIKPEFPQSETIGALSRDARLLFIQLWTLVDDEGRARAASRMLASLLYPYDGDAPKLIDKWLDELEAEKCIRRYVVEGNSYLEIINWLKHQKIDRPTPSRLPPYREPSSDTREPSRALDADLGPRIKDRDQGSKECPKREARLRTPYPEDFENGFWKPYPTSPNMSKSEALSAWKGLSEEERKLASAAVPAYRRWLTEQKDHPVVHACRFLKQRRFEGFSAQAPPANSELADELAIIRRQIAEAGNGQAESAGGGRVGGDHAGELRPAGAAAR